MTLRTECNQCHKKVKGMTLLELLVVVTTISILSMVIYPSYQKTVLKAYRNQAQMDLIKIQLKLEDTYDRRNAQFTNGYNFTLITDGSCSFCDSDKNRYWFSIDDSNTYTLSATPQKQSGQSKDGCGVLTLKASGLMQPQECWLHQ